MNCRSPQTCWLYYFQCQHKVFIVLLLPTELLRKCLFLPVESESRCAHWDIHDHRVTWQPLWYALQKLPWLKLSHMTALWFRHFFKWFLLQCSSNRRANLHVFNISHLQEIANQRLATFSVMFAMRKKRKQSRYLTPANENCHSVITNLRRLRQNKHSLSNAAA